GPQPRTDGSVPKRHLTTPRCMHIRIDRSIPPLKFMPRHDTIGDGLTTDKDLPHDRILAAPTDTPPKLYSARRLLPLSLLESRFGGSYSPRSRPLSSRIWTLRTLPVTVIGNSATMWTYRGIL